MALSVIGAFLTNFIALSAYADDLPKNLGRRAREEDASVTAERTGDLAHARFEPGVLAGIAPRNRTRLRKEEGSR